MTDFATLVLGADTRGLRQGETALDSLTRKGAQAETRLTSNLGQMEKGMDRVGAASSRLGPQIQNASFQIGDFATQVAAGQSATLALAQQLPQLLGGFGMVGAAAGAAVAVLGALAPTLLKGTDAARSLQDRVDDLTGTVRNWSDFAQQARQPTADLAAEFGSGAEQAKRLYEVMGLISQAQFAKDLSAAKIALAESIGSIGDYIAAWDQAGKMPAFLAKEYAAEIQTITQGLRNDFGLTAAQARGISEALGDVRMAKGPEAAATAAERLATEIMKAQDAGAELPPSLLDSAMNAAKLAEQGLLAAQMMQVAKDEAEGIAPPLVAASNAVDAITARVQFLATVFSPAITAANQLAVALANAASQLGGVASGIADFTAAGQGVSAVTGFFGALANPVETARKALAGAGQELARHWKNTELAVAAGAKLNTTLGKIGGSGGGKGGSAGAAATGMDEASKAAAKLRMEMERPFVRAVDGVADAWGNFLASGGRDFKGFADEVLGTFKSLIASLISEAAKKRIMIWLGLGQGGAIPGQTGGTGGGLSGLSSLISPDSWLGKGLSSGKGFLGGIGKLIGFGGAGAGAGAGGLAGLTSILGTAGAILGGIGAIIGIGKALFGRTLKDVGLQGSFTGDEFSGQTYKFYKGGLLRSNKTKLSAMDPETATIIGSAYADLRSNIRDMAGVLSLGSDAIADFAHEFKISTKDMSQEQIVQALEDEMAKAGAGMAKLILGTDEYTKAGESALDAMTRLATSLTGVRDVVDLLGHSFTSAGLIGANLASGLVDAFGGLEAMGTAVQSYWQAFYTEDERVATMTRQARQALAELGATMPRSRDEYRRMIESLDLSNASTHELYAALVGMSGIMDQILPSADALTRTLARLTGNVSTALDGMITATGEAQEAAASAAGLWYAAAGTIRDTLIKMRGTASALISAQQARAFNEAQYQALLARSMAGDATAVQQITGAAQTMLSSIRDTSATRIEAALAEARVLSDLGLLQGVADIEGARHDVIAGLLGQQIDVLTDARDLLANGGSMDEAAIAALNATLGSLSGAIEAAEQISYASLKARLDLTMGSIDASSLPPRLRAMLSGAADSISAQVDFIARSELPADLKWLALTGTSEHITTVKYLAENNLGAGLTRLALNNIAEIQRTVNLVTGSTLPPDAMRVALAASSELSRTVNATLASGINRDAMRLALGGVSDLAVRINSVIEGGAANPLRRLLRLAPDGMEGRITLGGNFVFDPSTGFSTWFERTTTGSIAEPMAVVRTAMGTLTGALDQLREAVAAETARQDRVQRIAALNAYVGNLTANKAGKHFVDDTDLANMAKLVGLDTTGLSTDQIRRRLVGYSGSDALKGTVYDPTGDREKAYLDSLVPKTPDTITDPLMGYRLGYLWRGSQSGEWHQIVHGPLGGARTFTVSEGENKSEWLKKMVEDKKLPAFAAGGSHTGGWRIVGENGPELEHTPPSRIYNASRTQQMLGSANDALISEVRSLKDEVASMRSEQRQLQQGTYDETRKISNRVTKWDANGLPPERA